MDKNRLFDIRDGFGIRMIASILLDKRCIWKVFGFTGYKVSSEPSEGHQTQSATLHATVVDDIEEIRIIKHINLYALE